MKRISSLIGLACCIAVPLLAGGAHADGMRCNGRIVGEGDSMYTVQTKCGVPDGTARRTELRSARAFARVPCAQRKGKAGCFAEQAREVEVSIEEWTYDFGPSKFVRVVVFENGYLRGTYTTHYGVKQ